jgi:ketosteroid isomerase-like protein
MTDTETGTRDEADIRGVVKERIAALRDRDADRLAATYAAEVVK